MGTGQSERWNFKEIAKNSSFRICHKTQHATHLLKLVDKICKYEMDMASIVDDTQWTRFFPQTDRWTNGQGEASVPRVISKFVGWPWKTIRHLLYAAPSFVLHFFAIYQFKMELQSGNVKFGSKSAIFCPVWHWNLTDDLGKQWGTCLCYFKICVSFHSHLWN